jgi:hypothetical protein
MLNKYIIYIYIYNIMFPQQCTKIGGFLLLNADRQFPDKAIDLIDEACATASMKMDSQREGNATLTHIYASNIVGLEHTAQVCSLNYS